MVKYAFLQALRTLSSDKKEKSKEGKQEWGVCIFILPGSEEVLISIETKLKKKNVTLIDVAL